MVHNNKNEIYQYVIAYLNFLKGRLFQNSIFRMDEVLKRTVYSNPTSTALQNLNTFVCTQSDVWIVKV